MPYSNFPLRRSWVPISTSVVSSLLLLSCASQPARNQPREEASPGPITEAVEVIRFTVPVTSSRRFLEERVVVDAFVSKLPGYLGTEAIAINEREWVFVIRWVDKAHAEAAREATLGAPEIDKWLKASHAEFVSLEKGEVRYRRFRADAKSE